MVTAVCPPLAPRPTPLRQLLAAVVRLSIRVPDSRSYRRTMSLTVQYERQATLVPVCFTPLSSALSRARSSVSSLPSQFRSQPQPVALCSVLCPCAPL